MLLQLIILDLELLQKLVKKIAHLVHTISPIQRAESGWSSTPRIQDRGGMDQEDEAQYIGETRVLLPAVMYIFMSFSLACAGL